MSTNELPPSDHYPQMKPAVEAHFTIPAPPDPEALLSTMNEWLQAASRLGASSSLASVVVNTYAGSSPASVLVSAPTVETSADQPAEATNDALAQAVKVLEESLRREAGRPGVAVAISVQISVPTSPDHPARF